MSHKQVGEYITLALSHKQVGAVYHIALSHKQVGQWVITLTMSQTSEYYKINYFTFLNKYFSYWYLFVFITAKWCFNIIFQPLGYLWREGRGWERGEEGGGGERRGRERGEEGGGGERERRKGGGREKRREGREKEGGRLVGFYHLYISNWIYMDSVTNSLMCV